VQVSTSNKYNLLLILLLRLALLAISTYVDSIGSLPLLMEGIDFYKTLNEIKATYSGELQPCFSCSAEIPMDLDDDFIDEVCRAGRGGTWYCRQTRSQRGSMTVNTFIATFHFLRQRSPLRPQLKPNLN
jgi:hypothetical protein